MNYLKTFSFPLLFVLVFTATVFRILIGRALLSKFGVGAISYLNWAFWQKLIFDLIITLLAFAFVTFVIE